AAVAGTPGAMLLDRQIAALEKRTRGGGYRGMSIRKVTTRSRTINHMIDKWTANPGLMAYKLQSNTYKFSWLLIPLSVPFVWLLFAWRRRYGPYDHAVF